jgi:hypothetical protein
MTHRETAPNVRWTYLESKSRPYRGRLQHEIVTPSAMEGPPRVTTYKNDHVGRICNENMPNFPCRFRDVCLSVYP